MLQNYRQAFSISILSGIGCKCVHLKTRVSSVILQTSQNIPKHTYRTLKLNLDKDIKDIYMGMEKIKPFLFAGDMIIYKDIPKQNFFNCENKRVWQGCRL